MVDLKLEIVSNGIIKTVKDTNYNGAGEVKSIKTVYDTEGDKINGYVNTMKLFYDVSDDLGIDMGNKFDQNVLGYQIKWGTHYEPTLKEVTELIKETKADLSYLQSLQKDLKAKNIADEMIKDSNKRSIGGDDDLPF